MTMRCGTCMAREADPSEYHDDACPVFQEQAAWKVGHEAGYRAGIEAAARLMDTASLEEVPGPEVAAMVIRMLADAAPAAPKAPERGEGGSP